MSSRRVKELPISFDDYDDVEAIVDGLSYDGFNPELIRNAFYKKKSSDDVIDDVLTCLIAYMMVGNNIDKLTMKVSNEEIGMKMKKRLKAIGVKSVAKSNSDITLPRAALSFMPAYYLLRLLYENKLQNQTSSKILIRYKDLAFAGVPTIWNMNGYKEYYVEFGKLINSKEKVNDSFKESMEIDEDTDINHWLTIAQNGYASDSMSNPIMDKALNVKSESVSLNNVKSAIVKIMKIHFPDFDDDMNEDGPGTEDKSFNPKRARMSSEIAGRKKQNIHGEVEEGEV